MENNGRIFKENSLTGRFGLDSIMLNKMIFESLEEIEIVNTLIEFIEAGCLLELEKLQSIRLENVGLRDVAAEYFSRFEIGQVI